MNVVLPTRLPIKKERSISNPSLEMLPDSKCRKNFAYSRGGTRTRDPGIMSAVL